MRKCKVPSPNKGIIEKKKTKGGHISSHFKSKYKDILTEAQAKDKFNRIGIPESEQGKWRRNYQGNKENCLQS